MNSEGNSRDNASTNSAASHQIDDAYMEKKIRMQDMMTLGTAFCRPKPSIMGSDFYRFMATNSCRISALVVITLELA